MSAAGGVLEVRLANADRANALTAPMLEALADLLRDEAARSASVVLLGGEGGRHFSSGLDLGHGDVGDLAEVLRGGEALLGLAVRAIEECPRPVVAVIDGAAMGGALELAVACDWRIAGPGARFAVPAGRLGVVYTADGLARFVSVLGPARTRRLFLTGATIPAAEALTLGLVDHLVAADDELWPAARAAAADVCRGAPLSLAGVRQVVAALAAGDRAEATRRAAARRAEAFESADFREGLAAFRERRDPQFRGV